MNIISLQNLAHVLQVWVTWAQDASNEILYALVSRQQFKNCQLHCSWYGIYGWDTLNSDMQGGCSTSFKQPFLVSSLNIQDDVHCLSKRLTLFILNWHLWDIFSHVRSIGDEIFRLVSTWLRSDENVGRCSMLNRNAENTEEVIGWQHLHPDIKHSSWRCMNCGIGLDPFTNIWL